MIGRINAPDSARFVVFKATPPVSLFSCVLRFYCHGHYVLPNIIRTTIRNHYTAFLWFCIIYVSNSVGFYYARIWPGWESFPPPNRHAASSLTWSVESNNRYPDNTSKVAILCIFSLSFVNLNAWVHWIPCEDSQSRLCTCAPSLLPFIESAGMYRRWWDWAMAGRGGMNVIAPEVPLLPSSLWWNRMTRNFASR